MERKYRYKVKLTGWDEELIFYDWEDVQCFLGYVVDGKQQSYTGFLIKMEVVK